MKKLFWFAAMAFAQSSLAADPVSEGDRLKQLDRFWAAVSQAVASGDFAAYQATCHPEGVLVSGSKKMTEPLAEALKRWKSGFDDTRAGKMKASVQFKFSQRIGDANSAHESGMFFYQSTNSDGKVEPNYTYFEALLVKRKGKWKTLMEYQKSKGTREEYEAM